MSTNKTTLQREELQHGDEAAALPPPPEAHPLAGAPTESLRQADEPPSEATQSPNPSQPGGPEGTAGALTGMVPHVTLSLPVQAVPNVVLDEYSPVDAETPSPASEAADDGRNGSAGGTTELPNTNSAAGDNGSEPSAAATATVSDGAAAQLKG